MFAFVTQYATQEAIILLVAFMGWIWKRIHLQVKEDAVLKEGIVSLLHDRLYQECILLIRRGWASVEDKNNIEHLSRPYFALGGNGTGKELYERCMGLPMDEPKEHGSG